MYDDRTYINKTTDIVLSNDNYHRLTIPPGVWFGFKGLSLMGTNKILNVASIKHDPLESETCNLATFPYNWNWRR